MKGIGQHRLGQMNGEGIKEKRMFQRDGEMNRNPSVSTSISERRKAQYRYKENS